MKFQINDASIETIASDCLVVAYHKNKLSKAADILNQLTDNEYTAVTASGDLDKTGSYHIWHKTKGIAARRVVLVSLGTVSAISLLQIQKHLQPLLDKLVSLHINSIHFDFTGIKIDNLYLHLAKLVGNSSYRPHALKSSNTEHIADLKLISFAGKKADTKLLADIQNIQAIGEGVLLTKKIADLPSNICTPSYMAEQAIALAKEHNSLNVEVQSEQEIIAAGMGAFASVSRGSSEDAKLVTIEYLGGKKQDKPYVIIGKGVTFDTGGISIKPSQNMEEMKYDMCGAASVLGIMKAVAICKLPINLVGVMGCTENMPSGNATKPGDIVTTMSGQTVEIINTDAEGRLVLCDCLTYVKKYNPKAVIDMATLTGACVVALGHTATGLYANNHPDYQELGQDLQQAANISDDKAWLMPLWPEYHEDLHSNFADIANCGPRGSAGSISAACFLEKFVSYPWAHLDIAGTAWKSGKNIHATGRPVPMIMQYLISR